MVIVELDVLLFENYSIKRNVKFKIWRGELLSSISLNCARNDFCTVTNRENIQAA